jgi:hypothetical protein
VLHQDSKPDVRDAVRVNAADEKRSTTRERIGMKPEIKRTPSGEMAVYLEKRRIGTIERLPEGYQYVTKSGMRGEVYPSSLECYKSLVGEPVCANS